MKLVKKFLILLFPVIFSSCAFISFEKLKVDCNLPDELFYFSEENVTLTFSIIPDNKDIENNVNFKVNNSTIECDFTWDNNILNIKPKNGWEFGAVYEFNLSNSLLMEDGRQYKVDIRRIFYYGDKEKYLQLESCNIENDKVVTKNQTLEFNFNNSLDILSFNNNFLISPTISYTVKFTNENKTVTVTPSDGWNTNSYYTWTLSDFTASDGYPLKKTYSQSFYAPQDTVKPEVQTIYPVSKINDSFTWLTNKTISDMTIDNNLGLVFTEPVDFETLKNGLTITPNLDGYLIQSDTEGTKFIYVIQNSWSANTEYEIKVAQSVKDKNDITLYEDYIAYFTPVNTLFQIQKITIEMNSNTSVIEEFNETPIYFVLDESSPVFVRIEFSKNVQDEFKSTVQSKINMNSFFPTTSMSPVVISTEWENDSTIQIEYKGFSASTNDVKNYYKLLISGGVNSIFDEYGNYLEEDVCVYVITWQQ